MDINSLAPRAKSAVVSSCGHYTYRVDEEVANEGDVIMFLGMHAIPTRTTHTTKRYRHFARKFGARKFIATNLFARQAANARALAYYRWPIGPDYTQELVQAIREADRIILNYGSLVTLRQEFYKHVDDVLMLLHYSGKPMYTLGQTLHGHPLSANVASYDAELEKFRCV